MDKDELRIKTFLDSLKLGSKGIFVGALAINIAYLIATNVVSPEETKIPISGISIPNKETAITLFILVYFLSGLFTLFAVARAEHILSNIKDREIQKIAVMHPSLFSASFPVRWIMLFILVGAGWNVFIESYDLSL